MLFPCTMFYSNACWAPLVKCWDLSLLLPLTQTLCPNQCIRIWRGSSSPVIILWAIPPSCPSQTKKMGQVRVSHSMQPPKPMLTYVSVCAPVGECVQRWGQRRSAGVLYRQQTKQPQGGWTGRAPSSFTFRSLELLHKLLLFLKMCTVLKCHAHTKACN